MKHAVITGGSSGIGRAIARRLWQRGYCLTLIARMPQPLTKTKADLLQLPHQQGQKILTVSADVSHSLAVIAAIEQSIRQQGSIDLLINSAGTAVPGEFISQSLTVSEKTMAVNFFGSLYTSHTVLPKMVERGQGKCVFISSGVGIVGLYGYSSYCPSKFAVRGLAECLRAEMKPYGVSIAVVYPPDTDTPQLQRENLTKPPVTQRLSDSAKLLSADQVAQSIVRGIDNDRFIITPGLEMTLLSRLHSLVRPFLDRYFDAITAKTLAQIKGTK